MVNLPHLYRLQEIEGRLLALQKLRLRIAEDPELKERQKAWQNSDQLLKESEAERQRLQTNQRRLELELKTCQEHLAAEERKLYGGGVSSARELEQLQQKAAEYAKKRAALEDDLLQLMEGEEQLSAKLSQLTAIRDETVGVLEQLKQEHARQLLEVTIEEQDLTEEAEQVAAKLPKDWLERYRRIAKSHHGIGMAKVKSNSCGACHISLSESMLQNVKRAEDTLLFCESCGRILYYA
ncbi:putative nucleic acid-binding Zn-ribbon protein [Hydrogenispora ethanolica]|jgi:predicted  nucleic acid-binding Zn-ribbon protein|uniref:Putative nucleic acid-binding Zn-ribbon protein n=1 Tax=Hydrogenispora ethanolica TaxID=1082276 RepID=A0A4R1R7J5_HYDET|nr:C4-type zinc ribbon domain-containing protein [Hydrogenispora ethanolica]TCL61538.1 putative nucleic acid-binding Zn-ribbon protein [Hydrogenispora ethanolica]